MYTGHFAAALAIKARVPRTPSWVLFVGVTLLDILWCVFMTFGIEQWRKGYVQIGWSHSLIMSLCWGTAYGACFFRHGPVVCMAAGLAVFSHFVLDWPVHLRHLPLYPYSIAQLGLGLGQDPWGMGWWLELMVILGCSGYYLRKANSSDQFGRHAWWSCGLIISLHVLRAILHQ